MYMYILKESSVWTRKLRSINEDEKEEEEEEGGGGGGGGEKELAN